MEATDKAENKRHSLPWSVFLLLASMIFLGIDHPQGTPQRSGCRGNPGSGAP